MKTLYTRQEVIRIIGEIRDNNFPSRNDTYDKDLREYDTKCLCAKTCAGNYPYDNPRYESMPCKL